MTVPWRCHMCMLLGGFTDASNMGRIYVGWHLPNFLQNLSPGGQAGQGRTGNRGGTLVFPFGPYNNHQSPASPSLTSPHTTFSPACSASATLAFSLSLQHPTLILPQGVCTACFLCLEHFSARYLHSSLPHPPHMFFVLEVSLDPFI